MTAPAPSRLDRRRARTRAALVQAAQHLLAEDRTSVSVLEITTAADVGLGSFYNHFESKAQLFEAAVDEVLELHGASWTRSPQASRIRQRCSPARSGSPAGCTV